MQHKRSILRMWGKSLLVCLLCILLCSCFGCSRRSLRTLLGTESGSSLEDTWGSAHASPESHDLSELFGFHSDAASLPSQTSRPADTAFAAASTATARATARPTEQVTPRSTAASTARCTPSPVAPSDWRSLYAEQLEYLIYQTMEGSEFMPILTFLLVDVDNNGVPELLHLSYIDNVATDNCLTVYYISGNCLQSTTTFPCGMPMDYAYQPMPIDKYRSPETGNMVYLVEGEWGTRADSYYSIYLCDAAAGVFFEPLLEGFSSTDAETLLPQADYDYANVYPDVVYEDCYAVYRYKGNIISGDDFEYFRSYINENYTIMDWDPIWFDEGALSNLENTYGDSMNSGMSAEEAAAFVANKILYSGQYGY